MMIVHLISIITLFNYFLILYVLLRKSMQKSTDIFQYKIYNFPFSIFCASFYILVLLGFYLSRIYRAITIDISLDLPRLFYDFHQLWLSKFSHINLIFQIYLIMFVMLFFLAFLLLLIKFHQFFVSNIFNLYMYFKEINDFNFRRRFNNLNKVLDLLTRIANKTILTHMLKTIILTL